MRLSKQISLGIDPMTGRRIRKRVYGSTTAEIAKKEKALVAEFARKGIPSRTTVEEYFNRWFSVYASNLAINTQNAYKTVLNKCVGIYARKMCDVTRTDLQRIINENWEHPDLCKRLAGKLDTIWECAVIDGVVQTNIAKRLTRPKIVRQENRPLTDAELEAISRCDFNEQEQLLVDILLQFGLRPAEAFALCKSDVDFDKKELHITKSLTHDHQTPILKSTKTQQSRTLPIPDSVMPTFKAINRLYFFVNKEGSLYTRKQMFSFGQKLIGKINRQMGGTSRLRVTDMCLYSFRHHKASVLYYTQGISNKAKAAYMGHSEEMFIRTYSHLMEKKENMDVLREETVPKVFHN